MNLYEPSRRLVVKHKARLPHGYHAAEWQFHSTQTRHSKHTAEVDQRGYCEYTEPRPVQLRLRQRFLHL